MFDLIEKRNSKGKSGGTANHSDAPITALYERLSCEDELDGESNSVHICRVRRKASLCRRSQNR